MTRVLLADDQAPDPKMRHLSDAELRQRCLEEYKDLLVEVEVPDTEKENFADGFVFLRKLVNQLQERGYTVDCATSPEEAVEKAKSNVYDAIILDLGWFTVRTKSYDEKMRLGWDIADVLRQHQSAPILMFSNRFLQDAQRAQTTAEKGLLPVYKTSDEACASHLLVTVRWAASSRSAAELLEQQRKLWELLAEQEVKLGSIRTFRWLSNILLVSIVLNVALIAVTVVFTLVHFDRKVADVSSVLGLLSTLISGGIFQLIRYYRRGLMSVPPTRRVQHS
jgi:CheY-like chemotaxis protein